MDISALTSTQSATVNRPSQSDAVLTSDFETFLQMLTTQARYQDPLEPIDSSEYAAQLAQFSMVEQQVKSNELLEALGAQLGSGTMAQMAGWIGMDARSTAPVPFDGQPITVIPKPVPGADEVFLSVYDDSGALVQRQRIPSNAEPAVWQGISSDGSPFPPGQYTFNVESSAVGTVFSKDDAETYARIVEARRDGADTMLILEGGSSVTSDAVTALRAPL
jgi:flagellar basal-body rod modification protein FlgD